MGTLSKLEVLVDNIAYDISDRVHYIHVSNEGFGIPPVERFNEQGPMQDGTTDIGFRLGSRSIQLVLMFLAQSVDDYWARRDELLYLFTPRETPLQLRFTRSDGVIRQIDAHFAGGMQLGSEEKLGYTVHKVGVQLEANDPLFYNPLQQQQSFGIQVSSSTFVIPLQIPWNIGSSVLNRIVSIPYTGTYKTHPVITIYGPVTNLSIINQTTGDMLSFSGHTINSGEVYTIDTRYGYKTVVDQTGASKLSTLTSDSDLATFSLVARPLAPSGINTIAVSGTNATATTQVIAAWHTRYIGV